MKKILKRIGIGFAALFAVIAVVLLVAWVYSRTYTVPKQAETIENTTGLVQAHKRALYDAKGNLLQLKGINAGQILLQEGWMSPFATEPEYKADGSYKKDADGNILYPEFTEEEFRAGMAANPNLADYTYEELMSIYRENFFTTEDFKFIKEELEFNTIRFPIYYLNLLNEDLTRKSEEEAFAYIDWFVEQAAAQGLYIVLDLHGAPGSQNGYEHSGAANGEANLWHSETYINATLDIWQFISDHYTKTRPELGAWIATYDILNEPTYRASGTTTKECWEVFDQIYDVIRANNDNHLVTMEGCWGFNALPDPEKYGWENVQYEYHWYNFWDAAVPYDFYFIYQDLFNIGRNYEVPTYIGEFTVFEDRVNWAKELAIFDKRGYSWTIWSYKTTVTGWWTSSWGVYTCQLNLDRDAEELKCNISTCTYEEFVETCEKMRTEKCKTGTLYEVLREYNGE